VGGGEDVWLVAWYLPRRCEGCVAQAAVLVEAAAALLKLQGAQVRQPSRAEPHTTLEIGFY
jgi:hypothetical protein